MSRKAKIRALVVCIALAICYTLFSARLIELQVSRHELYAARAAEKHVRKIPIHAPRGGIQDVRGEILAVSEPLRTIVADGSIITDPARMAASIAGLMEMEVADLQEKLTTERKYVIIKRGVKEDTARAIRDILAKERLRGLIFEPDSRRVYPNGQMLSHVLGFLNRNDNGVQGVEMTMNDYLRGRDGFRFIERDRVGREIVPYRGQERAARHGYNVRLTVDMGLQSIVEQELDAAFEAHKPEMASVILMEPKTGRILAMANRPSFDPNSPGSGKPEQMKNAAIINLVEPGSTFKIVTAAAALNDKTVTLDTIIPCERGRFHFAGKILKDHGHGPFPDLSVADVLVKSSNIGVAKMAMKLGRQRFYEYVRAFGFGERTGLNLPGEIPGILHPPHRWSDITISRIPMGQGVACTPLQMAVAMSAIANGGKLMLPQIVAEVVDDEGNVILDCPPMEIRRVVSEEVTRLVTSALVDVVGPRGTARRAAVPGFTVAGKTGTAQKAAPKGGYYNDKYVTSFIGFMPAEDPRFVCIVLLDDAKVSHGSNYGGVLAAPVFSAIGQRAAQYLNLQPDPTQMAGTTRPKITQSSGR